MKGGREKVGNAVAQVGDVPIQLPKMKRLRLPFGGPEKHHCDIRDTTHEHNIREIPLAGGGLGCALWDGGLVLTRWIYAHGMIFHDQSVLELGCGVALAGIMAAHWASHVIVTDYIDDTVQNALYNIKLNSCDETSDEDEEEEGGKEPEKSPFTHYKRSIASKMKARMLDWDLEATSPESINNASTNDSNSEGTSGPTGKVAVETQLCTRELNKLFYVQKWAHCETCWPGDPSAGCCQVCLEKCHAGHDITTTAPSPLQGGAVVLDESKFRCDCDRGSCKCLTPPDPIEPVDIIIGSELTYNLLSCGTLAAVVDKYLKPDGVFYEVLSDDRDGVAVFIGEIEKRGFVTAKFPAGGEYCGNFGTRKWSRQNDETYSFYTWRRAKSASSSLERFPGMK